MGLTAAQIKAMTKGDLENLVVASTPGGIVAQEARGQKDFVNASTLPKDGGMGKDSRETLELFDIKVIGDMDDIFYNVELPIGWHKEATDHNMWNKLIDEQGRQRASIFYKAAFYDRHAHISFEYRYRANHEPVHGYDAPYSPDETYYAVIKDCGNEIWRSAETYDYNESYKVAENELLNQYPDAKSLTAYW